MGNGKVIGEFICDKIIKYPYNRDGYGLKDEKEICAASGLTEKELYHYLKGATPYGWHISNLVIYDKPKELSEFARHDNAYDNAFGGASEDRAKNTPIKRPPQSWCYVEEIN